MSPFIFDMYIISLVYLIFILFPLIYLICLLTAGTKDLTLCPTDQHLVRLAGLVPYRKFDELVIHLGLFNVSSNTIIDQYPEYDIKIVNCVAFVNGDSKRKKR